MVLFLVILVLLNITVCANAQSVCVAPKDAVSMFHNPIALSGADPWMVADPYGNGYYFCSTTWKDVKVAHCVSPDKIGELKTVFAPADGLPYSHEIWAPELHYIDGEWYLYVAADNGDNGMHRMFVLKGTSQDPTKPFEMVGKIYDETDIWAIDGTVLRYGKELYFVWSGAEPVNGTLSQNIYIAHMSSPTKIDSKKVMLTHPEYDWETITVPGISLVAEGPAALYKGSTIHIVYSTSFSQLDDYCLGLLTFRGGDIMDPSCWSKSTKPVFSQADQAYGPGHCSFIKTPDGMDWIVYHANLVSSSGWDYRSARIQPFTWRGDMPYFGTPVHPEQALKITYKKEHLSNVLAADIWSERVFEWFK